MQRITLKMLTFALAAFGGCAHEPTAVVRQLDDAPQYVLVNGPVTPIDGGLVTSPLVTIDDQTAEYYFAWDPHISGDLACYSFHSDPAQPQVRYFRFSTGENNAIPQPAEPFDHLCDVHQQNIVFARFFSGKMAIMLFDEGTASTVELDPQPGTQRGVPSIGGNTVAFIDRFVRNDSAVSGVRVADLLTPALSQPVSTTGTNVFRPRVSPDGNVIVWNQCYSPGSDADCDLMKALKVGSTWGAPELVAHAGFTTADTDGSYIVYGANLGSATGSDINIQAVAGGPVTQLAIPGDQAGPAIRAGVIAFATYAPGTDVFVYVIATNTLYQITDGVSVSLSDVDVLSNGDVRVVWDAHPGGGLPTGVYAKTFTPAAAPTFSFGGFLAPVQDLPTLNIVKAGAAIPVKFSLGGDRGLNIFAHDSPSSVTVACNSSAPTGTVEETVGAGNSSLSYDATSDTYSYIWKTNKAWANTCRKLTLRFVDGTVANADFQFTK